MFFPDIVTNMLVSLWNIFQISQPPMKGFAQIFLKFNEVWTSLKIL